MNANGLRRIEVEPHTPKCGIYGIDEELAAAEDVKLQITNYLDSLTAVGMHLGLAVCLSDALARRAATVHTLLDALTASVQSQFLLLRAFLCARMAQLVWTVHRETLETHMHRADDGMWQATAAVPMLDWCPEVREYGTGMECSDCWIQGVQYGQEIEDASAAA